MKCDTCQKINTMLKFHMDKAGKGNLSLRCGSCGTKWALDRRGDDPHVVQEEAGKGGKKAGGAQ